MTIHLLSLTLGFPSSRMKFNAALIMALAQAANVISTPASPAAAKCGDLGVSIVNETLLPPNVDPSEVRACVNHPIGGHETTIERSLEKRACYYGPKKSGCDKGYCWKKCGEVAGPWCWTARADGFGDWYTCKSDSDCNTGMKCGNAVGGCKDCGCSC